MAIQEALVRRLNDLLVKLVLEGHQGGELMELRANQLTPELEAGAQRWIQSECASSPALPPDPLTRSLVVQQLRYALAFLSSPPAFWQSLPRPLVTALESSTGPELVQHVWNLHGRKQWLLTATPDRN
jgi:hypothetical protein